MTEAASITFHDRYHGSERVLNSSCCSVEMFSSVVDSSFMFSMMKADESTFVTMPRMISISALTGPRVAVSPSGGR